MAIKHQRPLDDKSLQFTNLPDSPKYRLDIDGLRAIAVISVVVFHAFPTLLPAGFIGVDIFFVISGFLISSIIFSQLEKGSFSFLEFYKRRILRIFPPLIVVLTAAFIFAWYALLSEEFKQLGKHIASAAVFISNFTLWNESGYFDQSSDTKPLLHLWSLAIEEQFYILYPLVIWSAWKQKIPLSVVIIVLLALSFSTNIYLISDPSANFYFPGSRFWELMIGALLASLPLKKLTAFSEYTSIAGIFCLVLGFVFIDEYVSFPSYWALLPTLGTVFLLLSTDSFVNRKVLSQDIFVWVGKISYPLYLWHWILFSFARIIEGESLNFRMSILLIAASVLLAWLSTYFIENYFRFGKESPLKVPALILSMVVLGLSGLWVYFQAGLPSRDDRVQKILFEGDTGHDTFFQYAADRFASCSGNEIVGTPLTFNGKIRCFQSKTGQPTDVAIIGDSHAEHLFVGFAETYPDKNFVYFTRSRLPLIDSAGFSSYFEEILKSESPKTIFLNAYWPNRVEHLQFQSFENTIGTLLNAGKDVYLFDDVPDYDFSPDRCKFTRLLRATTECSVPEAIFDTKNRPVTDLFQKLQARFPALHVIYSSRYFCDGKKCSMVNGEKIFYRDKDHLNINGSIFLAKKFALENPTF